MIAILGFLARLSVILGFIGIAFSSISDTLFRTDYLGQLDSFIDLSSLNFKILSLSPQNFVFRVLEILFRKILSRGFCSINFRAK